MKLFDVSLHWQVNNVENVDLFEVEAAPVDISINPRGVTRRIDSINAKCIDQTGSIIVLTESVTIDAMDSPYTLIIISRRNVVFGVLEEEKCSKSLQMVLQEALNMSQGGCILAVYGTDEDEKGNRAFLRNHFTPGDLVKFRKNGTEIAVQELKEFNDHSSPVIQVDQAFMSTTHAETVRITGKIYNIIPDAGTVLKINGTQVPISADSSFGMTYTLGHKTNFIDVKLYCGDREKASKFRIIYKKNPPVREKDVLLWVDQGVNAKRFQSCEAVCDMLRRAKAAGVTTVTLDAKGYAGFVSYKKTRYTGAPYVSEMKAPAKAGANPHMDLLEVFVECGHELGLKVNANINIFSGGSMTESSVLDTHTHWEEILQHPMDQGALLPASQSKGRGAMVFLNPAHEEVQQYQLHVIREILEGYDIDGITLDRCRYNHLYSDFSQHTRRKFEEYLESRGEKLRAWSDDVFRITEKGSRVDGRHFAQWCAFRSGIISDFTAHVRKLVDECNRERKRNVQLSVYAGSWYHRLYENGINWASPNFRYDSRLEFAEERIYTEEYQRTGYAKNFDYILLGTYQRNIEDIKRYITLGNILANNEVPVYTGLDLSALTDPLLQRQVFCTGLENSEGIMLFDLITCDFDAVTSSLTR